MLDRSQNIDIQTLHSLSDDKTLIDVLRLDQVHPIISGNKWFKLKYYLEAALSASRKTIASFGGAFSNHIIATAYAGKIAGLKTAGFIRGEEPSGLSHTLQQARSYGMELHFTDRNRYRNKTAIIEEWNNPDWFWIPEGGYGETGAKGAAEILQLTDTRHYSHILCAAGTGTMMAGLIRQAQPDQLVIGTSVLKGNYGLEEAVRVLLTTETPQKNFIFLHDYHFGGYAKHPETLISFMRLVWELEQIPTDIVYTSKLLYAAKDLAAKGYFPPGSQVLLIHSGGLQGNSSLPPGTLPF